VDENRDTGRKAESIHRLFLPIREYTKEKIVERRKQRAAMFGSQNEKKPSKGRVKRGKKTFLKSQKNEKKTKSGAIQRLKIFAEACKGNMGEKQEKQIRIHRAIAGFDPLRSSCQLHHINLHNNKVIIHRGRLGRKGKKGNGGQMFKHNVGNAPGDETFPLKLRDSKVKESGEGGLWWGGWCCPVL